MKYRWRKITARLISFTSFVVIASLALSSCVRAVDNLPPKRSFAQPCGELDAGTTETTISIKTDEKAICKYSLKPSVSFTAMPYDYSSSNSTSHSQKITGLKNGKSYNYYVRCKDREGNQNSDDYVISFKVANDNSTGLILSDGLPKGTLAAGTTKTTISLNTNRTAICKYDTDSKEYSDMAYDFAVSNGRFHSQEIKGLSDGSVYRYFVRCKDKAGIENKDDFVISFSVGKLTSGNGFVVDHSSTNIHAIPQKWIDAAKANIHAAYNHTSHGSQLITGLNALQDFPDFGNTYAWSDDSHGDANSLSLDDHGMPGINDLSNGDRDNDGNGYADWADITYDFLTKPENEHINVILWSWCNIGSHDMDLYIKSMEWLIAQFSKGGSNPRAANHPVKFVFITGHANGQGENDSSDSRNRVIRAHVAKYDRILFDFSDIENYDPDNNYYLDKLLKDDLSYDSNGDKHRDANWAVEYIARHPNSELAKLTTGSGVNNYAGARSCAHSNGPANKARLNCVLKGRATWYLFARLAGWDGQ